MSKNEFFNSLVRSSSHSSLGHNVIGNQGQHEHEQSELKKQLQNEFLLAASCWDSSVGSKKLMMILSMASNLPDKTVTAIPFIGNCINLINHFCSDPSVDFKNRMGFIARMSESDASDVVSALSGDNFIANLALSKATSYLEKFNMSDLINLKSKYLDF